MKKDSVVSPRAGRVGALLGILLLALSLRAAVVSVSPLLSRIETDIQFTEFTTGLLAMLAPIAFAVFGLLTPRLIKSFGLETTLMISLGLAVSGQIARIFMPEVYSFLALSIVTLAGYGMGNVVLPPLVKKYFPDRIGMVTSGYVTMLAIGTWMAPQFSVPLADLTSWQMSIGSWAALSGIVLIPWLVQLFADRGVDRPDNPVHASGHPQPIAKINPWKSKVAWGLAIFLAGNSAQTYVYFTWLPPYLQNRGLDELAAGNMLALFAILGLPVSLLVPLWVPRLKHPIFAVLIFTACWVSGHLGIYLSPTQNTAVWICLAGLGQGTFAIALLMMNLRSRTTYGSGVLSGFAQGLGYAGAAVVPMLFGVVQKATDSWGAAFSMLGVCVIVMLIGAFIINSPRTIEDDSPGTEDLGKLERIN
ncbi:MULTISPECIES: MFS transporter [Glutamicibacter]|uniref:MFS transporter n=2 Tax=Glutamicibacter arilaitensis TaxID=256701 RepID=A0A2N7RZ04_9MICC|nr:MULTISPECIES: MFS transporter [Glutamicibacter]PMQ19122.1 MFS transporter [Glutamicibacter arilaitensis]CBT76880.1 MFS superfamily transporter [Glutamicibacter arilaitensis Re117]HCH47636.1 MFS transporter [Glutamicibacter sp.]HCJ55928.1 MFS transporter [Glutamicibacter sp.]HCM93611.1 MFS transporter [Glutamicibacter sp.]